MSEPFLERLTRFTPDAGRLDRDALIFAAGRASARPNRGWVALAALLAGTQALSLAFLWPHAGPAQPGMRVPVAMAPAPRALGGAEISEPTEDPALWSARHSLLESEPTDRPAAVETGTFVESGPPLRAFASPPSWVLN
jgi:hypothetical protein